MLAVILAVICRSTPALYWNVYGMRALGSRVTKLDGTFARSAVVTGNGKGFVAVLDNRKRCKVTRLKRRRSAIERGPVRSKKSPPPVRNTVLLFFEGA